MKWRGCSGSASKRLRSWPTKLSTVRTEPADCPHTRLNSCARANTWLRIAHEEHEQLELEVGELHLDAVAHDHALREIDRDVVEAERARPVAAAVRWQALGGWARRSTASMRASSSASANGLVT